MYYCWDIFYCEYCDRNLKYLNHEAHFKTKIHKKNIKKYYFFLWKQNINFKKRNKFIVKFI